MKHPASLTSLLLALPFFANAAGLHTTITNLISFVNETLIPFMLGIAFLFFVINAIRFFVFQGANEDGRENAKNLALYGVFAFVILTVFWAIVNLLSSSIGLEGKTAPTPDYVEMNAPSPAAPASPTAPAESAPINP
ncbi:MAG: hypothetical protein RL538_341 [Candidatus Parcubacteria bacterium]|jgi:glucose uptake protein GlcU